MKKCKLSYDDTFSYTIYSKEEAWDMFGYEDEDLSEMPEDLYNEYRAVYDKFWEMNKKLRTFLDKDKK